VRVGETWDAFPAEGLTATVRRTGRPAQVHNYRQLAGGEPYAREGLRSAVGMPIHIDGRLWGMIAVGSDSSPLQHDTEQRMAEYIDLIATAVAYSPIAEREFGAVLTFKEPDGIHSEMFVKADHP
jgi:GAF domain-containing protein